MSTCPVHVLGPWFLQLCVGETPFAGFSAASVLSVLRSTLGELGISDAGAHRTHDFRRGHAQDLVESGSSLAVILAAGEWKSPAFMAYIDHGKLEAAVVVEAHANESSDSD